MYWTKLWLKAPEAEEGNRFLVQEVQGVSVKMSWETHLETEHNENGKARDGEENFKGSKTKTESRTREPHPPKKLKLNWKVFFTAKETITKMKSQPAEWEKIFANDMTNKELIFKIYSSYNSISETQLF